MANLRPLSCKPPDTETASILPPPYKGLTTVAYMMKILQCSEDGKIMRLRHCVSCESFIVIATLDELARAIVN